MSIEDVQTNLRIPSNLKEQLQASADACGRSLSAEAAFRLAQAFELERVVADMHGAIGSLQTELQTATNAADGQAVRIRQGTREVAKLEQQLETLKESRQADLAAATKHFEDRIELLAAKLRAAEKQVEIAGADLAPTVARMERDIAKLEVDKAGETLTLRVIASALRPLLEELPSEQILGGILEGATVSEWRNLCDGFLKNKVVKRAALDEAFSRLKKAEGLVRDLSPGNADPVWERWAELREAAGGQRVVLGEKVGVEIENPSSGDIVQPRQDEGTQHRPAAKRRYKAPRK